MSPARAPAKVQPREAVAHLLNRYKPVIAKLLAPTGTNEETFVAQVANALRSTPKLWECEPETILGAALRCAQLDLAPNDSVTNHAWIIPYGKVATFSLGYGGVLELARRAIPGVMFDGRPVYPGDLFEIDYGREPQLRHVPAVARSERTRQRHAGDREAFAWYVRARFADGRTHVHVLDRTGVEYHRSFSKQPDGEMWTRSYDAAALKSVVLDMRRWLPQIASSVAGSGDGAVYDVRDADTTGELEAHEPEQLTPADQADADWVEQAIESEGA